MTDLILIIAKRLREQYGAKEIILYGSYAKGEETADSDIDILVISDTKERFCERQATVKRLLRGLKSKVAVSPIVLTPAELDGRLKMNDVFIKEIMDTGKIITADMIDEMEKWLLSQGATPVTEEMKKEPWYAEVSNLPSFMTLDKKQLIDRHKDMAKR